MSNAATVQGIYEAFGRGDIPAILDHLSEDVVWDAWTEESSGQSAGGDRVVAQISVDVTVRDTGRRFRDDEIHLWVFGDDGRVVEFRHYVDTGKHAAAAGRVPAGV
jgi:hypothetical protein